MSRRLSRGWSDAAAKHDFRNKLEFGCSEMGSSSISTPRLSWHHGSLAFANAFQPAWVSRTYTRIVHRLQSALLWLLSDFLAMYVRLHVHSAMKHWPSTKDGRLWLLDAAATLFLCQCYNEVRLSSVHGVWLAHPTPSHSSLCRVFLLQYDSTILLRTGL